MEELTTCPMFCADVTVCVLPPGNLYRVLEPGVRGGERQAWTDRCRTWRDWTATVQESGAKRDRERVD
jgi:hypothetical protein